MSDPIASVIQRLRLLEQDHDPDGWPAVQMRDITALLDHFGQTREALRSIAEGYLGDDSSADHAGLTDRRDRNA